MTKFVIFNFLNLPFYLFIYLYFFKDCYSNCYPLMLRYFFSEKKKKKNICNQILEVNVKHDEVVIIFSFSHAPCVL